MPTEVSDNFLGIDWGARVIGLALADPETRLALPHGTLENTVHCLDEFGHIIETERVGTVVIGIPSHVNREVVEYPGEILGRQLAQRFGIQVAYHNEMFTTKMAKHNLIERGEKRVDEKDDAEAARIILQEWLDHEGLPSDSAD